MSEATVKDIDTSAADHHVMDILNPTLHHHDFLQSYVRTREVGSDAKQGVLESEELTKETQSNKHTTAANVGNNDNRNGRYGYNKCDKNNDKKEKEKVDITTIESEVRIQKSKRR